jgi:hypothetical protein
VGSGGALGRDEIDLEPVQPAKSSGLSGADLASALEDEAQAWNAALAGCDVPHIRIAAVQAEKAPDGRAHGIGGARAEPRAEREGRGTSARSKGERLGPIDPAEERKRVSTDPLSAVVVFTMSRDVAVTS